MALIGTFFVIVKTDGSFVALVSTLDKHGHSFKRETKIFDIFTHNFSQHS